MKKRSLILKKTVRRSRDLVVGNLEGALGFFTFPTFIRKSHESKQRLRPYRELGQVTGYLLALLGNLQLIENKDIGLYGLIPLVAMTAVSGVREIVRKSIQKNKYNHWV